MHSTGSTYAATIHSRNAGTAAPWAAAFSQLFYDTTVCEMLKYSHP